MPVLVQSDKISPTWLKIKTLLEDRLRAHRAQLPEIVAAGLSSHALLTAGRIAEIQYLLSLDGPEAP